MAPSIKKALSMRRSRSNSNQPQEAATSAPPLSLASSVDETSGDMTTSSVPTTADSTSSDRSGSLHSTSLQPLSGATLAPPLPKALQRPGSKDGCSPHDMASAPSTSSFVSTSSEAWTSPEEADGEYIRKTYLYFDKTGIQGDGVVEGREWTRHRAGIETPWDADQQQRQQQKSNGRRKARSSAPAMSSSSVNTTTRSPSLDPSRGSSDPDDASKLSPQTAYSSNLHARLHPLASSNSLRSTTRSSSAQAAVLRPSPLAGPSTRAVSAESVAATAEVETMAPHADDSSTVPEDDQSSAQRGLMTPSSQLSPANSIRYRPSQPASPALHPNDARIYAASPGMRQARRSETEISEISDIGTEEWNQQRETEQAKRQTLKSLGAIALDNDVDDEANEEQWRSVDRYGFFSKDWAGQHGRVCILPAACFEYIPSVGSHKGKGKAASAAQAARSIIAKVEAASEQPSPQTPLMSTAPSSVEGSPSLRVDHSRTTTNGSGSQGGARSAEASSNKIDLISSLRSASQETQRSKEQERVNKWSDMLVTAERKGGNSVVYKIKDELQGSEKLERRVFKGIPDRWRAGTWGALLEEATAREHPPTEGNGSSKDPPSQPLAQLAIEEKSGDTSTGPLSRRSTRRRPSRRQEPHPQAAARRRRQDHLARYPRLLGVSSPHDVQIDLDVPRTITNHVQFHTRYGLGQRSLFKVLHAFSLLCPECGYCQGMGSWAVSLLCYHPEEVVYSLLVSLHDSPKTYSLHGLFSPGFPGLMELFHLQEALMKQFLPGLYVVFEREGIVSSSYATRWYMTLFNGVVPFETQMRLWDVYFLKGRTILVLFAVAILHSLSLGVFGLASQESSMIKRKMTLNGKANGSSSAPSGDFDSLDFEVILSTLNHLFVPQDDEAVFRWIEKIGKDRKVQEILDEATKEWEGMKQQ